jgi:hypothetical protein
VKNIRPLLIAFAISVRLNPVKALLLASLLAFSTVTLHAEDWTTSDGIKYQDVKVVRVEDDAVTIIYKDGGALVFLNKLPASLQDRFDYDPQKAKVAAEARSKADQENAKALQAEIEKADQLKKQHQIQDAQAINQAPPKS